MNKKEGIASAIISVAVGLMLIIMKDDVISIALTVLGVAAIVSAIIDFIHRMPNLGLIKAVIGVCILVFGWMFVNLALYILAASIILVGLPRQYELHKENTHIYKARNYRYGRCLSAFQSGRYNRMDICVYGCSAYYRGRARNNRNAQVLRLQVQNTLSDSYCYICSLIKR